ncbi:hypothetical protein [Streptomyces sp. KR55]|uniref:hypothetical protein n=1 Tax=Streptomyces sp. KR55 TaxID=3457425 RepID=UPI003FD1AD2C
MICRPCRDAADGVPGARHCGEPDVPSTRCACQHRPPTRRAQDTPKTTVVIHVHPDPPHIRDAIRDVRRYGVGRG